MRSSSLASSARLHRGIEVMLIARTGNLGPNGNLAGALNLPTVEIARFPWQADQTVAGG